MALVTGAKENSTMKKTIDKNMPAGRMERIKDVLPSPEELALSDEQVKVTISLSKKSVEYFKGEARKHHTKYQKMIRKLLDRYTFQHMR